MYIYIYMKMYKYEEAKLSEYNFIHSLNYLPSLNNSFLKPSSERMNFIMKGKDEKVLNIFLPLQAFCFKFI